MKALSIRQPWIELILRGIKDVENRSWDTKHRGLLVLHAAKTFDLDLNDREDREEYEYLKETYGIDRDELVYGALVGTVEVTDVTKKVRSQWHIPGQYGWYLRHPKRFEKPIPWRGEKGLFEVGEIDIDSLTAT
ncbi:MAG: ASCH domain-containing protein [Spirochaetes bacterium]|nr:ASCH domain-containing protein [Spirochaetota bacterium]